jgi:hypothetical protein
MSSIATSVRQSASTHWVLTAIGAALVITALVVSLVVTLTGSSSGSSSSGSGSTNSNLYDNSGCSHVHTGTSPAGC